MKTIKDGGKMTRMEELQNASYVFGSYLRYTNMLVEDHLNDVEALKVTSKRLAKKMAADVTKTQQMYGEGLSVLEKLYNSEDLTDKRFSELCLVFTSLVTGRLNEIQSMYLPYAKMTGQYKRSKLESMIKRK